MWIGTGVPMKMNSLKQRTLEAHNEVGTRMRGECLDWDQTGVGGNGVRTQF